MTYGYMRLSTSEDKQRNSFEIQKEYIANGYEVDEYFTDTLSGSTPFDKRKGWVKLMSHLKHGDVIVSHRIDRVSRSMLNYLIIEEGLKKIGVKLIFVEGVEDKETPEAMLMKNMLLVMAEFERSMIRQRIVQSKAKCKSDNKYLGGGVPYGYRRDKNGEHLIKNTKEQKTIEDMTRMRCEGLSYGKIAQHLNRSDTDKHWSPIQVSRTLKRKTI